MVVSASDTNCPTIVIGAPTAKNMDSSPTGGNRQNKSLNGKRITYVYGIYNFKQERPDAMRRNPFAKLAIIVALISLSAASTEWAVTHLHPKQDDQRDRIEQIDSELKAKLCRLYPDLDGCPVWV